MMTLVIKPQYLRMEYSFFGSGRDEPFFNGTVENIRQSRDAVIDAVKEINKKISMVCSGREWMVVFILPYGGKIFRGSVSLDEDVITKLQSLTPFAPLHIPFAIELMKFFREEFPNANMRLFFQTSFFVNLPVRERVFAIPSEISGVLGMERYGFYGIFHEASVRKISRELRQEKRPVPYKIISICLEPRPEVVAVIGRRPVMVTTDATPIGGICGEKTPGEIDSSILLMLLKKYKYSPEKINTILTRESGLLALCGREMTIGAVLKKNGADDAVQLAGNMIRYQLLKALGAGTAAMGGIDGIVFSGRYRETGSEMAKYLLSRLFARDPSMMRQVKIAVMEKSTDRITADLASTAFRCR
ncbi:MAG: acetate/propionate family kinase [Candidatus Aureabacteria bacterium]|nr:acetate/propionate family kinase [Candidatus Auribacterota bacterium]